MKRTSSCRCSERKRVWHRLVVCCGIGVALALSGCAALLPRGATQTSKPWSNFNQAHAAYERIQPYVTTTVQLRQEGIAPLTTPNVTILSYADIVRRLLPPSGNGIVLDPGIRDCMNAQTSCRGYEIDQRLIDRKRVGNFWLDFLDFRRETVTTGWRFNMLLLVVNDRVVYKLWGGQPEISEVETTRNPLGPLQGLGPSVLGRY